ncbi:MAG TPA: hypothetical protein ENJ87_00980 [Gammaproteobacteria bacterium]|nr:hypothetical protein [Gammaproteobacteria bacterium]
MFKKNRYSKEIIKNTPENTTTKISMVKTKDMARRITDKAAPNNPALKRDMDRRNENSERRDLNASTYHGPARRYIIDRRQRTRDRRKESEALA